jgi:hypothetical protein
MNTNANITNGYSVEEREEQIAAVQRLRRKMRKNPLAPAEVPDRCTG